ncbi:MAG: hypothetical protein KJ709_07615, partial [Nanoarchaeota archaeon]|nr:hypothetical protein [Nanoarchaeota archaeon]
NKISFQELGPQDFLEHLRAFKGDRENIYVVTAMDAETYGHMRNAEESHYRPVVKGDGRPSSDDDLYLEFMPDAVPDAVANSMHEKASVNWGQWECAVNSEIKSQFLVNRDLDYYIGNALIERDSCVLADFVTKRKGEDFWRHFLLPIPLENADRRLKQIDEKLDCYGIKGRTRN